MTERNWKELEELAGKATPGEWGVETPFGDEMPCIVANPQDLVYEWLHVAFLSLDDPAGGPVISLGQIQHNAAFIAAANPQTVLTLLSDLKAKDARIAELERALGPFAQARLVSWGKRADEDNWFHVRVKLPCDPNGAVTRACKTLESNNG